MHRNNKLAAQASVSTVALLLTGCRGIQSTLDPAGQGADQIATLFWWMVAGSALVWLAVIALTIWAKNAKPGPTRHRQAHRLIMAGALTPAVVLCGLLMYGLTLLPQQIAPAPEANLRIRVYGEQWWWRVRYEPRDGQPFELANEIKLPVNQPVQFLLHSSNVIHSFWIPSLGGKMDMIPGRVNHLVLRPTRTGVFRGTCAEYCGIAHARMAFYAIVVPQDEFTQWMAQQSGPAGVQQ